GTPSACSCVPMPPSMIMTSPAASRPERRSVTSIPAPFQPYPYDILVFTAPTGTVEGMAAGLVTLFLCGDVMLGRGVDQVLPHPGDPQLRETYARDARAYVRLAERANGRIPRPARFCWPWGDALAVLDEVAPDARVINLETAVTRSAEF